MSEFLTGDSEEGRPPLTGEELQRALYLVATEIGLDLRAKELQQEHDAAFEAGLRQILGGGQPDPGELGPSDVA